MSGLERYKTIEYMRSWRRWEREIVRFGAKGDLPGNYRKHTLLAVAWAITTYGTNGMECYPTVRQISADIWLDKNEVAKYRKAAIDMGWFTIRAKVGRREILDVTIATPRAIAEWSAHVSNLADVVLSG